MNTKNRIHRAQLGLGWAIGQINSTSHAYQRRKWKRAVRLARKSDRDDAVGKMYRYANKLRSFEKREP